ncbi:MAG: hypothetical protein JNN30_15885 [Rhodanobacteraceae bacterium]|nr:hypothetical protein [Rhodanobacteraceae bacterium]
MIGKKLSVALAAALIHAPLATAQTVNWRIVAGEDGRVITAGLPDGTGRSLTDAILGDAGADLIGLRITSPSTLAGYWARQSGNFVRYAQADVTGTAGPNRSGGEAAHVFQAISTGGGGTSPDGQRLFSARAGESGSTVTASYGVWLWNGTRNIEIARSQTDGALGPGLGAGWRFADAAGFASGLALNGGAAMLDVDVLSPTNVSGHAIVKYQPGVGNRPCLRAGATEAALAPGLAAGDSFLSNWTLLSNLSVTRDGRVYGTFDATGSRGGIWEICSGAPRAIAVDNETGARGPDLGIPGATFTTDFAPAYPGSGSQLYFFSFFRRSAGASSEYGLFWHDGSRNRPMAYKDTSGFYGPNWGGASWLTFYENSLSVNGGYTAFSARVQTTDGGTPTGFWRVRTSQRPELVALIDIPGQYGPEPNRTWASFGASAILANGDLVLEARTNPGNVNALWLLEPGRAPRKLLEPGQTISIATTTGTVQTTVSTFDLPGEAAQSSRGRDQWTGADGSVLVSVTVPSYGEVLLTTQASDRIFRSSLE